MIDMEKAYAYEIQRRQTIGNCVARMSNLGYGNAVGVGHFQSTDEQDQEMENQAKNLEPDANGSEDNGGQKFMSSDKTEYVLDPDLPYEDLRDEA